MHGFGNPWAGMAAMGALIGGGIFDLFPRLRAAIVETAGGWVPMALDRMDTHYLMSPGHVPNLNACRATSSPRAAISTGSTAGSARSNSASRNWARNVAVRLRLAAGDTGWPEGVPQTADRPRLNESAGARSRGKRDAPLPAVARLTKAAPGRGHRR